jgi:uncharacterized repeat protein (TIGR03809 family)
MVHSRRAAAGLLTDLFETGRWRRYHSWIAFLENIQEANSAVETWRNLLTGEASADNRPINISWLDRPKAVPPRRETILYDLVPERTPQFPEMPADQTSLEARAEQHSEDALLDGAVSDEALKALPADNAREPGLDLAVMQDRYPLLRNAL